MSTICIDNTEIEGKGFIKNSKINKSEIQDAQQARGVSLNKMGTSIPTPYARLFLFTSAFSEINSLQRNNPHDAHNGATAYHALVSEWLDMMQFVFLYGNDTNNMKIIPWRRNDDLELLDNDGNKKHSKLSKALGEGIDNTPKLNGYNTIYIFRYNNVIVGGTSPLSLVYTSPNWKRQNTNHFPRNGENGGELFDDMIVPLHKRDTEFRHFIHKYIEKYGNTLSPEISSYIIASRQQYDVEINNEFNAAMGVKGGFAADFDNKYVTLKDEDGATVTIGSMSIFCIKNIIPDPSQIVSDYKMLVTSDRYSQELVKGEPVTIQSIPLVLSKHGMDGATYWKGQKWNGFNIPASLTSTLSTRELPGFHGTTYPYVTIDDFLEDKIIEVSYDIHLNKFFTGNRGLMHFLLPLKKEIFKFFNPKDLFTIDDVSGVITPTDMFSIEEVDPDSDNRKVVVRLNIPTEYGRDMEFVREYDKNSIVDCFTFRSTFDLAFFPFYRMIGGGKNVYNIMLGYKGEEKSAEFYALSNLSKPLTKEEGLRSKGSVKTKHIHLEDAFDVVELSAEGTKGLIIPAMPEKNVAANPRRYVFCIDFGTTNTHIAYGYDRGGNGITIDNVKPLDITESDAQTVYLNNHEPGNPNAGFGEFSDFLTPAQREFVPCILGDELFKMPMRTAVCEIPNLEHATPRLFENINVGFNYLNEIGTGRDSVYCTDIKWSVSDADPMAKDRVRMFFNGMMWIMKNKSVMNDGGPDFKLVFTYPQSMRRNLIGNFHRLWNQAREEVGATMSIIAAVNDKLNIEALEGIAPYFSFLPQLKFGETYANIDIGGGTTDIIYINPIDGGEKISYSAVFAANDLWGDGANPTVKKQNGFLTGYLASNRYANLTDGENAILRENLQSFMDETAGNSSDIISYLFSKDRYQFADYIEGSDLKTLLLIHLSSIIYYMALCFLRDGVEVPHHITFTGMGSKYLTLLGDDKCLSDIITQIFKYRMGREGIFVNSVDVRFADDPKRVTASGGVLMAQDAASGKAIDPERSLVYGWKNESYSKKKIKIEDIPSKKEGLFNEFNTFLDLFEDDNFIELALEDTGINARGLKQKITEFAEISFKQMQMLQNSLAKQGVIVNLDEPMFFWPLKDTLFQLSKQISSPTKQQQA